MKVESLAQLNTDSLHCMYTYLAALHSVCNRLPRLSWSLRLLRLLSLWSVPSACSVPMFNGCHVPRLSELFILSRWRNLSSLSPELEHHLASLLGSLDKHDL